jgi:hypothetical protein
MILDKYTTSIRANQAFLREVLLKHGNSMGNRWRKASQAKRALAVQNALPDIQIKKWAIYEQVFGPSVLHDDFSLRTTYLLPYLSLNDMNSDSLRFLSFLNARSKHTPDDRVMFDLQQTKVDWEKGYLAVKHCGHGVVIHGAEYGKLVPWEKDQAHRWDLVGFPRTQLVIELNSFF